MAGFYDDLSNREFRQVLPPGTVPDAAVYGNAWFDMGDKQYITYILNAGVLDANLAYELMENSTASSSNATVIADTIGTMLAASEDDLITVIELRNTALNENNKFVNIRLTPASTGNTAAVTAELHGLVYNDPDNTIGTDNGIAGTKQVVI